MRTRYRIHRQVNDRQDNLCMCILSMGNKIYTLYTYKRAKKMPEESGVGTVAEWSVPSSGIKKEVSVRLFSEFFSPLSLVITSSIVSGSCFFILRYVSLCEMYATDSIFIL